MGLGLVQMLLSEVGFAPSAASVEHVNGPTLPVISRSYVDTEFHGSLNSPVVNFADSNESLALADWQRDGADLAQRPARVGVGQVHSAASSRSSEMESESSGWTLNAFTIAA